MRVDAAGSVARSTYQADRAKEWRGGYVEGYDHDAHGIAYHALAAPHYDDDLRMASDQYWAQQGRNGPPPPSYQDGRLGRVMDIYGCQAMMRRNMHDWRKFFWRLALGAAVLLACGVEQPLWGVIIGFPIILAIGCVIASYRYYKKRRYMKYYSAQATILRSNTPLWVPYEKDQINKMTYDSRFQWP